MRKLWIPSVLATVLLSAALAGTAQGQRAASTPVDEARAVIDSAVSSFNGSHLEAYGKLFTTDVESFTGVGGALRMEGKAAWLSWIQGAKQLFLASTYEPHDLSYRSYNNDVVVANGYFVFTTVSKSGDVTTQTGRSSTVVVKVNGTWLIANQHYSAMF
jgi:ketosteroid isomerase-like protein